MIFNVELSYFRQEYHFLFDDNFEIRDDIDILKEMGLVMGNDLFLYFVFVLKKNIY